jgi:hypothetical protein
MRRVIAAVCLAVGSGVASAEPVPLPDDLRLPPPGAARDHPMLGAWVGDAWSGVLPRGDTRQRERPRRGRVASLEGG